jgi:hypothetical protein
MNAMAEWLRHSSAPLADEFPGLTPLTERAGRFPSDLVDLIAFELELSPSRVEQPPSVHVRIPRERSGALRTGDWAWLGTAAPQALAMLADVGGASLDGGELGFVCEGGDSGFGLTAAYANTSGDEDERRERIQELGRRLGIPATTLDVVRELGQAAPPQYVGAMVGRPGTPTRFVTQVSPDSGLWDALAARLPDRLAALTAARDLLASRSPWEAGFVNVDVVDGRLGPVIGLELKPHHTASSLADRSEPLRKWLVSDDCGVPRHRVAALARWEGRSPTSESGGAPTGADLGTLFRGGSTAGSLRRINHVKATFAGSGPWNVKAYLFDYRITLQRPDQFEDGSGDGVLGGLATGSGDDDDR